MQVSLEENQLLKVIGCRDALLGLGKLNSLSTTAEERTGVPPVHSTGLRLYMTTLFLMRYVQKVFMFNKSKNISIHRAVSCEFILQKVASIQ
jgi:hypothetical protein